MTDSLIIAEQIELLGAQGGTPSADPRCLGAYFRLMPGYDLSAPQPTVDIVGSLLLDGERPFGRRASNRTITLPVLVKAPDFLTLASAREVLLQAVDAQYWTLRWTRDTTGQFAGTTTPMPLLFDCFRAQPSVMKWGGPDGYNRFCFSLITLTFQALPYGRTDLPVIADFPSPLAGKTAPPSPVTIDGYGTVTGTHWSQATIGPGAFSAYWTTGGTSAGITAVYSRTGLGPFNLSGLSALTIWAGFGSTFYYPDWGAKGGGPVLFSFTLGDGTHSASFSVTRKITPSSNASVPAWHKIRVPIPSSSAVNFSAITSYSITVWSRSSGDLPFVDLYLSEFTAVPGASPLPVQPAAGAVYDLAGILGSARTPISLALQQPGTATTVRKLTITGGGLWLCPAGVTTVKAECVGPGGRGSTATTTSGGDGRAGGGGGEYAAEATLAVTPGNAYAYNIPAGGNGGSGTPGNTTFAGDSVTVTAHGGHNVASNANTGGAGGTGSSNAVHHDGGTGGSGGVSDVGGGGGGSGGATGAGGNGQPGSGTGAGGTAGTGGSPPAGAGGTGGLLVGRPGGRGSQGGGGGGGAFGSGSTTVSGGQGGAGEIQLTYTGTPTFKTLIAHRPNQDAPDTLTPFVSPGIFDTPDGTTEYPVQSQVDGLNARFDGTYTVILVSNSWHSPSAARDLTVAVKQYEQLGGAVYSASVTLAAVVPNSLPGPFVTLGELTLPVNALASDNLDGYFTVTVTSGDTADRFQDVLFLDTMGETVIIQGSTGYANYYLDQPNYDRDLGNIMGSVFDRADAVSVLDRGTIAGPTLYASPHGSQQLLLYAAEGAPACEMIYWPRYWLDRTA